MRDDFLTQDWAAGHRSVTAQLAALIETLSVSLARLHARQFDAPWKREDRARCG